MKRILGIAGVIVAGAGLLWAAHRVTSGYDPEAWFHDNEAQVRRILNLPPEIVLAFKGGVPSRFNGYDKITLQLTRGEDVQVFDLYVTQNGQKLVYDRIYDLADPFAAIRETIKLEKAPAIGPEDALVTIVKYSDYTCIHCRRFYKTMQTSLLERYKGKIRFVHKLFPAIGYRQNAQESAVAAGCAFRQGHEAFWAMHHELFENVDRFAEGTPAFVQFARRAGLKLPEFRQCLETQDSMVDIARDQQEGIELRLDGTPSFFVNGRPIPGVPTEEYFYRIIDEELALAGQ